MPDTVLIAWGKGLHTACGGGAVTKNPYPKGTKLAEAWLKGWSKAADLRPVLAEAIFMKPPSTAKQARSSETWGKQSPDRGSSSTHSQRSPRGRSSFSGASSSDSAWFDRLARNQLR